MPSQLSPFQIDAIRTSLMDFGELPLAAHQAGITLSVLKRELSRDEDFAQEVEHLLAVHGSAIAVMAQRRAKSSDVILKTLLEARVPGFARDTRESKATTSKPTVVMLRQFDSNGDDVDDVTDVEPKHPITPAIAHKPAYQPPQL